MLGQWHSSNTLIGKAVGKQSSPTENRPIHDQSTTEKSELYAPRKQPDID
jgi:hypothetical protein